MNKISDISYGYKVTFPCLRKRCAWSCCASCTDMSRTSFPINNCKLPSDHLTKRALLSCYRSQGNIETLNENLTVKVEPISEFKAGRQITRCFNYKEQKVKYSKLKNCYIEGIHNWKIYLQQWIIHIEGSSKFSICKKALWIHFGKSLLNK